MPLEDILIHQIQQSGPVSFRHFMETALYYPGQGYYTSPGKKIGKDGDFYTSPYLTEWFGHMLAVQIEELWQLLGGSHFTIVEFGAGNGELAFDILRKLKANSRLYDCLSYVIIEKSEAMKRAQQTLLKDKIAWVDTAQELQPFTGCVLANEVVDNFAVHQVLMQDELMEVFVDYENGFKEILLPASPALKEYFNELHVQLPFGFRTEVNTEAITWLTKIAKKLNNGAVVIIDYGGSSNDLYRGNWQDGTLLCYHKHGVNNAVFINAGEQDITAHVNFSALKHFGRRAGLEFGGYTSQGRFLQSLGLCRQIALQEHNDNSSRTVNAASITMLQKLLLDMGSLMKVLVLQKGLQQTLFGMRFPLSL